MLAHNSVVLRNWNHPENNFMLTGFEQIRLQTQNQGFIALRQSLRNIVAIFVYVAGKLPINPAIGISF